VDRHLAQLLRRLLRAAEKALGAGLGPARGEQHPRVVRREATVQVVEQREILVFHAVAVEVDERFGERFELGRQRAQERLAVEHELVHVPYARREGESDAAPQIGPDGRLRAGARLRALGIEAHVVNRRAPAAQVPPGAERGRQLGLEDRHERPVEQVVLQVVVEDALLDRTQRPAVAVRIDEPGEQKLLAVAHDAGTRVGAPEAAPVSDGGDARAGGQHGRVAENRYRAVGRVRDDEPAADEEISAHGSPASRSMIVKATLVSCSASPAASAACW
jgi:hypothetical protein